MRPRAWTRDNRSRTGWRSCWPTTYALPWVRYGPRELVSPTAGLPDLRRSPRPRCSRSWYEFFPRSQGAKWDEENQKWISGTFDSSHERLEAAAAMGFDVVYLPPIHPIGRRSARARTTRSTPGPTDPGSPWAIGARGGRARRHPSRPRRLRRLRPVRRQGQVARARGCDGLRAAGIA